MTLAGNSTSTSNSASFHGERRELQQSSIKLEQVTPPSTPGEAEAGSGASVGLPGKRTPLMPSMPSDNMHSPVSSRYSSVSLGHGHSGQSPLQSPPMMLSMGPGYMGKGGQTPPLPSPHHRSPHHRSPHQMSPHAAPPSTLPSFSSFRQPAHSSGDYETDRGHTPTSLSMPDRELEEGRDERDKYPCDSVMDLSMNKNPTPNSKRPEKVELRNNSMPPPSTPGSESECEGKRDVSTTSATPIADNGIHHCHHCNIFFYDYTMYHLHESLHLPYSDYPFRCPSCGKHCQDRIEFMFHTVWHVKYPHTIPNYQPFKESFIT